MKAIMGHTRKPYAGRCEVRELPGAEVPALVQRCAKRGIRCTVYDDDFPMAWAYRDGRRWLWCYDSGCMNLQEQTQ